MTSTWKVSFKNRHGLKVKYKAIYGDGMTEEMLCQHVEGMNEICNDLVIKKVEA